jgi:hypothetical protein
MVGVGAVGREQAKCAALFGLRWMVLIESDSAKPLNLTGWALFREEHRGGRSPEAQPHLKVLPFA